MIGLLSYLAVACFSGQAPPEVKLSSPPAVVQLPKKRGADLGSRRWDAFHALIPTPFQYIGPEGYDISRHVAFPLQRSDPVFYLEYRFFGMAPGGKLSGKLIYARYDRKGTTLRKTWEVNAEQSEAKAHSQQRWPMNWYKRTSTTGNKALASHDLTVPKNYAVFHDTINRWDTVLSMGVVAKRGYELDVRPMQKWKVGDTFLPTSYYEILLTAPRSHSAIKLGKARHQVYQKVAAIMAKSPLAKQFLINTGSPSGQPYSLATVVFPFGEYKRVYFMFRDNSTKTYRIFGFSNGGGTPKETWRMQFSMDKYPFGASSGSGPLGKHLQGLLPSPVLNTAAKRDLNDPLLVTQYSVRDGAASCFYWDMTGRQQPQGYAEDFDTLGLMPGPKEMEFLTNKRFTRSTAAKR